MTTPIAIIIAETCERFQVSPAELTGPARRRDIYRARQAAMYVARTTSQRSYPEIGRLFGGRDHTSVLHAVRQVPELMQQDPEYQEKIVAIISAVIAYHVARAEAARGGVFRSRRAEQKRTNPARPSRTHSDARTELIR